MKQSLLNPRLALVALAVVLLVTSLMPARLTSRFWLHPRRILTSWLLPIVSPLERLGRTMRIEVPSEPLDFGPHEELSQDYVELQRYARQLEQQLRQSQDQIGMLTQLRQSLSLSKVQLLGASVVAPPGNPLSPSVTISQGERAGVAQGMIVAEGFHLVGQVSDVAWDHATVDLIIWPGRDLVARIVPATSGAPPRETRTIVMWDRNLKAFAVKLGVDEAVEVGDLAHLDDQRWAPEAAGLVIGRVSQITPWPEDPLLYRHVLITPVRPLSQITRVAVLVPVQEGN